MVYDKGRKTRQLITQKALQLFSVKGYFNTSISDIQEATGLTKGGLYCHFKSKEDISEYRELMIFITPQIATQVGG